MKGQPDHCPSGKTLNSHYQKSKDSTLNHLILLGNYPGGLLGHMSNKILTEIPR